MSLLDQAIQNFKDKYNRRLTELQSYGMTDSEIRREHMSCTMEESYAVMLFMQLATVAMNLNVIVKEMNNITGSLPDTFDKPNDPFEDFINKMD